MAHISIANTTIGSGCPPFIVAEVGINHNGEIEKAFQMIRTAKDAGANAVKFQTFSADEFVGDSSQMYTYRSQGLEITESMLEMFKRYEFSPDQWRKVKSKCDEEGILFLSTPQNRSDLDLLLELGIGAIKVGSDDFTNIPLLKDYGDTGLPLILSCGMADLSEIYQSLDAVRAFDGYPTLLLLCTSQYPTPPEDVNMLKLRSLSLAFPMIPLGFSDHTQGPLASSLAIAFGATFLEKHFTLDHQLPGPDHWFSEDPAGLKVWISSIRTAHNMMGCGILRPTAAEKEMRVIARRSIVAIREVAKGEMLTEHNLSLKRPGSGLPPAFLEKLIGMTATCDIPMGSILKMGDFA